MKSLGARLAIRYALASTLTLVCLFLAGRYFLEKHLVNGLDLLNAAQFEQIKARLGPDYTSLTRQQIHDRVEEVTEYGSVLFYMQIDRRGVGTIFTSANLHGRSIPDVVGMRVYNTPVEGLGEMRVGEFLLGPMDITIATSKKQILNVMVGYQEVFYGLLVIMFVVSALIGHGLSRMALRPVRLIQETATHISSSNLSERIPVPEVQDEISNLARLLNETFDRLESAFLQVRRFTAEASHELKTPLSLVRLQGEKLLLGGGLTQVQEEAVQVMLEEIARLNKIIEELLFLSRAEARAITLDSRLQDPRPFIASFATDARVLSESRGVRFKDSHAGEGQVPFDAKWIRQVLLNLLSNALKFAPAGSQINLTSALLEEGGWRVAVEDEGPGVPPALLERIFERFYRFENNPAATESGSGLGLAISRSVIELHQGAIRAEMGRGGRGFRVVFELPGGA
ncbi:MAG: ATP-binding protein [Opitutales bacterium]